MLGNGFHDDGRRFFRRPPRWKDVVSCSDIVQLNDNEAKVLGGFSKNDFALFKETGLRLLELGPR